MYIKNVKLSLWLPFNKLTNPAVVLVSDVTGTDWYVTSGRSLSIVRWRQLSFAADALNYSQIIMTAVFWATKEAASNIYCKEFYTC